MPNTSSSAFEAERDEWQTQCLEQARLNGMGSEREARLLAQIQELTREARVSLTLNARLMRRIAGLHQELGQTRQRYAPQPELLGEHTVAQERALLALIFPHQAPRAQLALELAEELAQGARRGELSSLLLNYGQVTRLLHELYPELYPERSREG